MNNAFVKVLRISAFADLWLSQIISQVFLSLLFFSLMIRVYQLTHSNSAVSLMILVVTLPNILLGAVAGVLVDRGDRKIVMFLSHFLRVFAVLAFFISSETIGLLYIFAFVISVITQFFFPAEASTIHEIVKDKKLLLTANSLFTLTFFVSVIVGNVLAGPFLSFFGPTITFLLVSGAFLIAALFTARLPGVKVWNWFTQQFQPGAWRGFLHGLGEFKDRGVFADFLAGLDHIYKNPEIARAIYVMGVSQITVGILGTIAPGFADKILKLSVSDVSIFIMAPAALGMVLGSVIIGQFLRNTNRQRLIKIGFFGVAVTLIVYSFVDFLGGVATSLVLLTFLGMANAFLSVPVNTIIQEKSPEQVRSRVFGVLNTAIGIAGIVPIVLAGVFADIIGVRLVMIACGALLIFLAFRDARN